jgi:transposase
LQYTLINAYTRGAVSPCRLSSTRFELELWLHKRFWKFEWLATVGEAERLNTIRLRRVGNRVYAIFFYELSAKRKEPKAVAAFDINENTVVVAKIDLVATVDKVTQWNRRLISITVIRTDLGRLARGYGAIRAKLAEECSYEVNGRKISGTRTREYRKHAKRLREKERKKGRIYGVANELTRESALLVTENIGERPQEKMIMKMRRKELRHCIKQTPSRSIIRVVRDKSVERGSSFIMVSAHKEQ